MKILQSVVLAGLLLGNLNAQAGQPIINLNVSGQLAPGVYGEVQFGNAPPPPLVYSEPRVIVRDPRFMEMEPLYLAVPPGHARNWRKHCRKYDACGRRVYFVRSEEYESGYRERHERGHDRDGEDEHHKEYRDSGDEGSYDWRDGEEGRAHHHRGKHRD